MGNKKRFEKCVKKINENIKTHNGNVADFIKLKGRTEALEEKTANLKDTVKCNTCKCYIERCDAIAEEKIEKKTDFGITKMKVFSGEIVDSSMFEQESYIKKTHFCLKCGKRKKK